MTTFSLTLQEGHLQELQTLLLQADGRERAAYLLCSQALINCDPWDGGSHLKLLSSTVQPIPDDDVIDSTTVSITWRTDSFVRALKESASTDSKRIVAIVHSHPNGPAEFSNVDDDNEPDLWQLAANRNGPDTLLVSILLTGDGSVVGRVWRGRNTFETFRMIRVVGQQRLILSYIGRGTGVTPEAYHRQELAFGSALVHDLRHLRIGIVGLGGTGSPVALMLARMGVGQIALFDKDIVDRTNLNRLHGSRQADADAMRYKVDVLRREISEMGLGVRVAAYPYWIGDEACRDAMKACDVIFGCTDDDDGRLLLNRLAYYYLVPVFDLGLAIKLNEYGDSFESLDGRVTVIGPGQTCLLCRGIVSTTHALEQALKRLDPSEYERRKLEAYVEGEGNPSPAVITFTTETATMALNEFLHRLQGFRGPNAATAERRRLFHRMHDLRPGDKPLADCPLCATKNRWARGDVVPFLDRVG